PTRIFDATSGWFTESKSDVDSHHVYFKPIDLEYTGRPLVLSEFGGYSYKDPDHSFNMGNTYGYRFFKTGDDLKKALSELYLNQVLPAIDKGLCATVLTQVSDVEDETNGLLTYDRHLLKVDAQQMQELMQRLEQAFNEKYVK
ncbi:MAG: glycoside hydrolase family 2, partial [Clostridia bacterium]|nr:glycoside hydrolase family 2 [Clostridia bacterium]